LQAAPLLSSAVEIRGAPIAVPPRASLAGRMSEGGRMERPPDGEAANRSAGEYLSYRPICWATTSR
jgi:hypothetical protein